MNQMTEKSIINDYGVLPLLTYDFEGIITCTGVD